MSGVGPVFSTHSILLKKTLWLMIVEYCDSKHQEMVL